jgi:hypothetical protein
VICKLIPFSVEIVGLPERDFIFYTVHWLTCGFDRKWFYIFLPYSVVLVGLFETGFTYFYLNLMNLWVSLKQVSHIYTSPHKHLEWYEIDTTYI